MVAKLVPGWSPATTCWIVHPTVHAKLFALATSGGAAVTLTMIAKTPKLLLLGIPVETTDVLPGLGTAKDVVLADLAFYTIGSRQDFALAYSGEPYFTTNQGVWRLTSQVDGAPHFGKALRNASRPRASQFRAVEIEFPQVLQPSQFFQPSVRDASEAETQGLQVRKNSQFLQPGVSMIPR